MFVVLIVAGVAVLLAMSYNTYEVKGTVLAKHIDYNDDSSAYVVVLTDGRTLEVQRQPMTWSHDQNPDKLYAMIQVGSTYTFTCWGWQNEWLYWYPNIIAIEEV